MRRVIGNFLLALTAFEGESLERECAMSTVTIRNLDPRVKAGLQRRAAEHGRSMEAEARAILAWAVLPPGEGLFAALQRTFADLGGVEFDVPPRPPARGPVVFNS